MLAGATAALIRPHGAQGGPSSRAVQAGIQSTAVQLRVARRWALWAALVREKRRAAIDSGPDHAYVGLRWVVIPLQPARGWPEEAAKGQSLHEHSEATDGEVCASLSHLC